MRGNPKIDASNQTARVCIANSARFFILAIFGFPLNTPLPTHAHSPFATAQGAPCQKRGFGAARYRVAREARFRATVIVALSALRSRLGLWLCYADTLPSRNLRGTNPHHSLRSIFIVNVCFKLRPSKGRLAKSAVLARRVIESREKRGFARHFLFRTTFGVRHSFTSWASNGE